MAKKTGALKKKIVKVEPSAMLMFIHHSIILL